MEEQGTGGGPTPANSEAVESVLAELVAAARSAFADALVSVVLFGSAAEGRLRPASDVNLLILLKTACGPVPTKRRGSPCSR